MQEKGSSHIHTYDTLMHGLKVSLSEHVPHYCVKLSHAGALSVAVAYPGQQLRRTCCTAKLFIRFTRNMSGFTEFVENH